LDSSINGHGLVSDHHAGVIGGIPSLKGGADAVLALVGFLGLGSPDASIAAGVGGVPRVDECFGGGQVGEARKEQGTWDEVFSNLHSVEDVWKISRGR
jgi:hypothetical protein